MSTAERVKVIVIDRMTVDLFNFWLDYDWFSIARTISQAHAPLPMVHNLTRKPESDEYRRTFNILWKPDENAIDYTTTSITFAQIRTDLIRVEFTNNGQLADQLSWWITYRFGVDAPVENKPTLGSEPEPKLTQTEQKVAKLLAQESNYEQIGVRLGDKSIHAARKHAQSLAKKWSVKQTIDILWNEAKRRGY